MGLVLDVYIEDKRTVIVKILRSEELYRICYAGVEHKVHKQTDVPGLPHGYELQRQVFPDQNSSVNRLLLPD